MVDAFKDTVFSSHNRVGAHLNSQRLFQYSQDPYRFKADKISVQGKEAKKLFIIDTCWKGEMSVFFNGVTVSISAPLHTRTHDQEYSANAN